MHTIKGIVFDLYGTLYDVHSVAERCNTHYPGKGMEISVLWRQKQLEYTWLRSLMDQYIAFEDATRDALVYTCNRLKLPLDDQTCTDLCDAYLRLDPYPDVPAALTALREMELPLAILSNGSVKSIDQVVGHSGLRDQFDFLLSVERVGIFKPHTKVYEMAEEALRLRRAEILFVSSNPWDASGACHFGYTVCWVNRSANTFDELGVQPDVTVPGLDVLPRWISAKLPA
jgi:2-haloacid dehalogenase